MAKQRFLAPARVAIAALAWFGALPVALALPLENPPPPPPIPRERNPDDIAVLETVPPEFPDSMKGTTVAASVLVRVLVSKDGTAASVEVEKSSGVPAYDDAAVSAVRHWRFKPRTEAGKAIDAYALIPLRFDPQGD